jgi:hypothetical protein
MSLQGRTSLWSCEYGNVRFPECYLRLTLTCPLTPARRTWFADSAILQPTHWERVLGNPKHTSRYGCDISTCCCITSTRNRFFSVLPGLRLGLSRVVLSSPCSATSADKWASTNPVLASRSIPVLKCSRLKRGSRDRHPGLKSNFHDRWAATFKARPSEAPNRCTWAMSVTAQQLNCSEQGHCRLAKALMISKSSNDVYKSPAAVGTINHSSLFSFVRRYMR